VDKLWLQQVNEPLPQAFRELMRLLLVAAVLRQISYYLEQTVTVHTLSWNTYAVIMLKFVLAHVLSFGLFCLL
jgi:hypothetical protein